MFNNAVTAQYTHNLTVTERLGGQYHCNVTNNKPSISITELRVQDIYSMGLLCYNCGLLSTEICKNVKLNLVQGPLLFIGKDTCGPECSILDDIMIACMDTALSNVM